MPSEAKATTSRAKSSVKPAAPSKKAAAVVKATVKAPAKAPTKTAVKASAKTAAPRVRKSVATTEAEAIAKVAALTKPAAPKRKASPKSTTKASPAIQITGADRLRHIELAAYFLAEKRGFHGGNPAEDWLIAEQQIDHLLLAGKLSA